MVQINNESPTKLMGITNSFFYVIFEVGVSYAWDLWVWTDLQVICNKTFFRGVWDDEILFKKENVEPSAARTSERER